MMNIKKLIIPFFAVILSMSATAQLSPYREFSVFEKNHYWVEAGATYNKTSSSSSDYKTGFRAGFGADIPLLYSSVSFLPSLVFEYKGFTNRAFVDGQWEDKDVTAMYIEVPIDFSVNIPIGKKTGIQIAAGPYLAFATAGKYTESSDNYLPMYGTRTLEFYTFQKDEESERSNLLKKFDFGVDLGVRVIFLRYVMVKLNAEFGTMNMCAIEGAQAYRNRSFSASMAFRF